MSSTVFKQFVTFLFVLLLGSQAWAREPTGPRPSAPHSARPASATRFESTVPEARRLRAALLGHATDGAQAPARVGPPGPPASPPPDGPPPAVIPPDGDLLRGAPPPPITTTTVRRNYESLVDNLNARLEAKNPIVVDEATFAAGRLDLASIRSGKPQRPPATAGTATVSFTGDHAVVDLGAPARTEVIRVELPPKAAAGIAPQAKLEGALRQLPEVLMVQRDRIEKIVWSEDNYAAVIGGKLIPLLPTDVTERDADAPADQLAMR
ncbi:hypothetical protein WMF38_48270 [Sorangium sp. So ce118]